MIRTIFLNGVFIQYYSIYNNSIKKGRKEGKKGKERSKEGKKEGRKEGRGRKELKFVLFVTLSLSLLALC